MIANDALKLILQTAEDLSVVCEIYAPDASPPFDPADAIERFANAKITFLSNEYKRLVSKYGSVKRTIGPEINSASVDFSNLTREIAEFERANDGFEGLVKVIRLISRSQSDTLEKSMILFAGRCEKIDSGTKETLQLKSKYVVGATDVELPRRKFTEEDPIGRTPDNILFEGFRFLPQYGSVSYSVRVRRGGLLGLLGFKKTITKNLQYSSFSDLEAERVVPLAFGRVQMEGMHLGYIDVGNAIRIQTAFCEGQIADFINTRSDNPQLPLSPTSYYEALGELGGVGTQTIGTGWVAPGYYSRTANIRCQADHSQVDVTDAAPGVVSVVIGLIMSVPDAEGDWTETAWSDNPAAVTRFVLTSENYHKLAPTWIHDESFTEAHRYNDGILFDTSSSDFLFVPDSATLSEPVSGIADAEDFSLTNYFLPTSSVSANWFKYLSGEKTVSEVFGNQPARGIGYDASENLIPIEPIDPEDFPPPPGGGTTIDLLYYLRRRFTFNGVITEQQKLTDFLHNVVFTASRMFLSQAEDGRIKLNHKKPADFGLGTVLAETGDDAIALDDISPWITNKKGFVLVDAHTTESEIHTVTDANYSAAQNSVTLTASDNITISGFSGCDGGSTPASATITIDTVEDENDFALDGIEIAFGTSDDDTVETMAGFVYASINAHPILRRKFRAEWTAGDDFVTVYAKFGTLVFSDTLLSDHSAPIAEPSATPVLTASSGGALAAGTFRVAYSFANERGQTLLSPFESITVTAGQKIDVASVSFPTGATAINWFCVPAAGSVKLRQFMTQTAAGAFSIDNDDLPLLSDPLPTDINRTGAECMRVAMVFTDRAEPRTGMTRSNVIKSSYKWMLGTQSKTVNQVEGTFRDATNDFKLTKIILKNKTHIEKTKKISKKELNLQGIDNYNQAFRIVSGTLAEQRDADFFYQHSADKEALLLEEGDVICVTDDGARLVNFPVRIESIEFGDLDSGHVEAKFTSRKYASTLYDDAVAERQIPVAIETGSYQNFLDEQIEYAPSNFTETRTLDASTADVETVANVLATVMDDLNNLR